MKQPARVLLFATLFVAVFCKCGTAHAATNPIGIILDTDVDHDCDDIGALFILHGAMERGEADLLATIGCTSSDAIAPALDGINSWFGRPGIPVGTLKSRDFLDHKGFAADLRKHYPGKFAGGKDYPDAVAIYRQVLAKQPDGSVVVLAVGPLINLANLLKSSPDKLSPLDGVGLVAKKVKRLEVMGGNYPPVANAKDGEWNFKQDPAAAALVCSTWPTPVLFNGEGGSTCSGRRVTYEMPEHNPLTMAYRLYPNVGFAGDRLSWDSVSALVSVRGAQPWYDVVSGGTNITDPVTGINTWSMEKDRGHSYLVLKSRKPEVEKALEDMQTSATARPVNLKTDTLFYADAGMCAVTHSGGRNAGVWQDKEPSGWIQFQHVDDRKRLVTSYALTCTNRHLLPRSLELLGSNDGGSNWTRLDLQEVPGFSEETTRREFNLIKPAKWNVYRLNVKAADEREGIRIDSIELLEAVHSTPGVGVASVMLDKTTLSLPVHGRATLNASLAPVGITFSREVGWSSSDPDIAEVRQVGEQTAIVIGKKPGSCVITGLVENAKSACSVTVTNSTLPQGWSYHELNAPPIPGAVLVAGGKFTLTGCGHAMTSWWERVRDQGVFAAKAAMGDLTLSAQLTSLAPHVGGPTYAWDTRPPTAAGLMIRDPLHDAAARYFLVQVDASGKLLCRWRGKTNDQDDNQSKELGKISLPAHLKMVRKGHEFQIFTSADGQAWGEPHMSHTADFGGDSRIGLFVCSGNSFASSTATFENVSLQPR